MAIIPARYASTRLPAKPLIQIRGKSIIQRVCERVRQAKLIDHFCVATDDILIYNHVKKLGFDVVMTRYDQPSGTYRCAEVLSQFPMVTHVINVQGDEPLIHPEMIDQVTEHIISQSGLTVATLIHRLQSTEDLFNPNVVKVVINHQREALYFSRQAIPYVRGTAEENWITQTPYYRHVGLYAYTSLALTAIERLQPHPYEMVEKLEQLTWLANGFSIQCIETKLESRGIDTEEDLREVSHLIEEMEGQ
jgi:3-deoxy-manno-octulosonate cytidylyltransferase (CMP-KDO synthetase)